MTPRRLISLAIVLALLNTCLATPARATSTENEVIQGRIADEEIVLSNVIETDPLLNAYVQSIADKLWKQVARKDVPYNIKIIKSSEVDAFSTEGGYVYVYEGMLDFVQSDDELAGVIGHETGHIERRHVVTMQSKAQALGLLFGLASLFSPIMYNFGNLMEAGAIAKMQRADEIQADRYGLQLMSRAGYDPNAMLTMLSHLGVLEGEHADVVDKYLQDHPEAPARIAHLKGYPELDPTIVTEPQKLVQADSDEERDRYNVADMQYSDILKTDPTSAEALLGLSRSYLALGYPSKGEQTLQQAAQIGSPQTRAEATSRITALEHVQAQRVSLVHPNLTSLHVLMQQAQASQASAFDQIQTRRDEARDQVKAIKARTDALQYEAQLLGNVNPRAGSRLESVFKNLIGMQRGLNSAIDDADTSVTYVGSLEKNKESGLLKESRDILAEMQAPLDASPMPADSVEVLPSYPSMLNELGLADGDMLRSVDAARASLTLLDSSIGDLDALLKQLGQTLPHMGFNGDLTVSDYKNLVPTVQQAVNSVNAAATAASQSSQLYNMARTRQLSARISLLGVGTSPERYATLQDDLQQRLGLNGIAYTDMLHDGVTPGDVTVATILAADTKGSPQALLDEAKSTHQSIIDVANAHGMHAWPLEIFTGLVYLDYTDDPIKEVRPNT